MYISQGISLNKISESFPKKAKTFFDYFFKDGSKDVNDFLGVNFQESIIFFDEENNPILSQTEVTFSKKHQTFDGRIHGAVISGVFDIGLAVPLGFPIMLPENKIIVTRELSKIEILQPVPANQKLLLEIRLNRRDARKFWMTGVLRSSEKILATAEGFLLAIPISY